MPAPAPATPFTLTVEDLGATALVHCHGKLLAEHADQLYVPVAALIPTHGRIVLDLTGLTQMDSLGLGTLVRLYVSARGKGCTLELHNIGKKVRDLLILTNLLAAFTVAGERHIRM